MIDRPGVRRDEGRRQVSGQVPAAKADAARSVLEAAGLAIEVVDEITWRVEGYDLQPATGMWTAPDGKIGYGVRELVLRLRPRPAPGGDPPVEPAS